MTLMVMVMRMMMKVLGVMVVSLLTTQTAESGDGLMTRAAERARSHHDGRNGDRYGGWRALKRLN